jgi:hypothetical protein
MPQSTFEYSKWVEEALRRVVRRALEQASGGLTGSHHFYVTFRTDAPGVEIPDYLHTQYPREMTIVLQHQFWHLKVYSSHFDVTLSFNRVNETLSIPYSALTSFSDPSVNFGLQLKMIDEIDLGPVKGDAPKRPLPAILTSGEKPALPLPVKPEAEAKAAKPKRKPAVTAETPAPVPEAEPKKSGEVIAIDAFRKK